jgi:tRNA A-37 threonylcarbamoyl transferase component Bud32
MVGYLKSEHRVRMRSRLHGFFSGCRFGSKSRREQRLLQALALEGIGCPEWIAVGEDDKGRAFLLVREIVNTVEMPVYLQGCSDDNRRALCKRLGQDLARMHDAGFDHPDLYAKHVLIRPADKAIFFLDWQRSRRHTHVPWRRRARDLAALNASLAEELASCRHRLACLGAYLRTTAPSTVPRRLVPNIERRCRHLLRRRRVREMRQPGAPESKQRLIRLDGDGLCVSSDFRKTYPDVLPAWLETNAGAHRNGIVHEEQTLADGTAACLTRRSEFRPIRGLVARLVRWRQTSPELREVGVLFRLERFGITIARVLAFGQRHPSC